MFATGTSISIQYFNFDGGGFRVFRLFILRRVDQFSLKPRLTYDFVRSSFEEYGCVLLSSTYQNANEKLEYLCKCGNNSKITFNKFVRSRQCRECSIKERSSAQRHSYEYVKGAFEKRGFVLIDTEYMNAKTPLKCICACGEETKKTLSDLNYGYKCRRCGGNYNPSFAEVKAHVESYGYTLLSNTYKNVKTRLSLRCVNGHEYEVSYASFKYGHRCRSCLVGPKHPRYNNEISDEERHLGRNFLEYRDWRKEVYERDGYTCQCCRSRGGRLNAHHIENYADNKLARVDIKNGITLCAECHTLFHRVYGRRGNNFSQLNEFIERYRQNGGIFLFLQTK